LKAVAMREELETMRRQLAEARAKAAAMRAQLEAAALAAGEDTVTAATKSAGQVLSDCWRGQKVNDEGESLTSGGEKKVVASEGRF
jgi:hypothetical protein